MSAPPEVTMSNWRGGGPSCAAGKTSSLSSPPDFSPISSPHALIALTKVWDGGRKVVTFRVSAIAGTASIPAKIAAAVSLSAFGLMLSSPMVRRAFGRLLAPFPAVDRSSCQALARHAASISSRCAAPAARIASVLPSGSQSVTPRR